MKKSVPGIATELNYFIYVHVIYIVLYLYPLHI